MSALLIVLAIVAILVIVWILTRSTPTATQTGVSQLPSSSSQNPQTAGKKYIVRGVSTGSGQGIQSALSPTGVNQLASIQPINPATGRPAEALPSKFGLQVVTTEQENQLKNQGIIIRPGTRLPDQFNRRPFNTLTLSEAPPEVQKELLTGLKVYRLQGVALPDEFDCRDKWPNLITIPMDQGNCGSCWAFASATAVSDRFRISDPEGSKELTTLIDYKPFGDEAVTYRILNNLSPYELVYCDICSLSEKEFPDTTEFLAGPDGECDHGCEGGFIQHVYRYIKEVGISSMLCNPPDPNCDPSLTDCPCVRPTNCKVYKPMDVYAVVSPTDPPNLKRRKIQENVFLYGPVTAGFKVYKSFFDFFDQNPDGVYTRQIGGLANDPVLGGHAVDIIGWGTQPVFHWLVRNSWSPVWSEEGNFRIQYDFGGILNEVMGAEIN